MKNIFFSLFFITLTSGTCNFQYLTAMLEKNEIEHPITSAALLQNLPAPMNQWDNVTQIRSHRQQGQTCGYYCVFNAQAINDAADDARLEHKPLTTADQRYQDRINNLIDPQVGYMPAPENCYAIDNQELDLLSTLVRVHNISTLFFENAQYLQLNGNSQINLHNNRALDFGLHGKMPHDELIEHIRNQPIYHFACIVRGHWVLLTAITADQTIILTDSANWNFGAGTQERALINRYIRYINRAIFNLPENIQPTDVNQPQSNHSSELRFGPEISTDTQHRMTTPSAIVEEFSWLPIIGLTAIISCLFYYQNWIIDTTTCCITKIVNTMKACKQVVKRKKVLPPPALN